MGKTVEEMLAEAKEGNWGGGRKLTFREKCGAFAALYDGQVNQIVARAFGISVQATSKLSGCLENDPDPYRLEYATGLNKATGELHNPDLEMPREVLRDHNRNRQVNRHRYYQDVAREFEALGPKEFIHRYYTERVHNRIMVAKEELRVAGRKIQK